MEQSARRRPGSRPELTALAIFAAAGIVHVSGLGGSVSYPAITAGAVVVAMIGLRVNRPPVTWPWISLLITGVLWTFAGIARDATGATGDLSSERSYLPDLFALPGYLLLGVAVYGFVRQRAPGRDIDALLDAILLIAPTLDLEESSIGVRWAIVIYPAISTCLLVLAGRIAFATEQRRRGFLLIAAGVLCLVIGDIAFALGEVGTISVSQRILELPYLAVAALFGSVALNPAVHGQGSDDEPLAVSGIGIDRLVAVPVALFAPLLVVVTGETGRGLWVQAILCTVLAVVAVTRLLRAIRLQAQLRAELLKLATHDELTGLPSRSLILDLIAKRLRDGSENVSVLFLDLDEFKAVNDSMGHGVGDEMLILVAERLKHAVRADDVIGRISGDEFVVVTGHSGIDTAQMLGDRIRGALRQPFHLRAGEVFATASIGVAALDAIELAATISLANQRKSKIGRDEYRRYAGELMQQADTAMYRSKERGKNITTAFDGSMKEKVQQRLQTERDLRSALELEQISVVYQPVVRGESGRIEGFEALMRWTVDHRNIPPDHFIPVAEACGLIVSLGTYVLNEACRQVAWWRANVPGAEEAYVSVNLSPRQVLLSDIVDVTRQALDDFDLPGDALWLEITETMLMEDTVTTSAIMQGLRSLGVRLAIDDFGTGFSSLSYLRQFPVSRVKIDRSFVRGLGQVESDSSLVAAIVAMAGAIGLDTVAEGVETAEQAELLMSLGCNYLQGYLYSPGVPPRDVVGVMVSLDGAIRRKITSPRRCRTGS